MKYPLGLVFDAAKYFVGRRLRGERRFPLVLTLDPLGGFADESELAAGNGALGTRRHATLTVAQCVEAMQECETPVVVVAGDEPLEYSEIAGLTKAIVRARKYLFLSTDGTLIRRCLHMFPPVRNFFWNVKVDGTEGVHGGGRAGVFAAVLDGIRAAKNAGFFVVVTSTVYPHTDVEDLEALYAQLHEMHVDGYMLAPHYPTEKLCREGNARFHENMRARFCEASERLSAYNLMNSPIYMEYLRGERELDCSVWANPVFGPQGWLAPCYLQNAKFVRSYKELLEETVWENYGRGLNPRCENCECPGGFETAAILGMNPKAGDFWKNLTWQFRGSLGEKRGRNGLG